MYEDWCVLVMSLVPLGGTWCEIQWRSSLVAAPHQQIYSVRSPQSTNTHFITSWRHAFRPNVLAWTRLHKQNEIISTFLFHWREVSSIYFNLFTILGFAISCKYNFEIIFLRLLFWKYTSSLYCSILKINIQLSFKWW